jgi:hypothetical protein
MVEGEEVLEHYRLSLRYLEASRLNLETSASALPIPKRSFKDDAEGKSFIKEANEYFRNSRSGTDGRERLIESKFPV